MNEISFSPFPKLNTKNFILRGYKNSDDQNVFIIRSDKLVLKYLEHPVAETIEDAHAFIKKINDGIKNNEWINWAITTHNDDEMLGSICLWNLSEDKTCADIGFALLPQHFGKGIMQEIVPEVLKYGFEVMNLTAIAGDVAPGNIRSIGLMKKFGFKFSIELENTHIYKLERPD